MTNSRRRRPETTTVTYGDHEVITPDNGKMRQIVRPETPEDAADDPVDRAETALSQISNEFAAWMNKECDRLDAARQVVKERGLNKGTRQELFLAAHDVKGDAEAFGYPLITPAADSLCRILEHTPDVRRIPVSIVDQHVDAVRAIFREYTRGDIVTVAAALNAKLRQVTEEFLIHENRHRPDYLKKIGSPSIVPAPSF